MKIDATSSSVCQEAIYQFVYSTAGKELGLFKYLLRGRPKRGTMKGRKIRKSTIPERVSIHERPDQINSRQEFGHYEGDLTFNHGNQSINITTLTERKSRFVLLVKNESKKTIMVMKNTFDKLAPLPPSARLSMTYDNGTEFTTHTLLKYGLKMDTYFCDPHSPWQKGQVEKTNAMIHRYIPKNRPLFSVSYEELALVQDKLNSVPRKILGYRTPAEVFAEYLSVVVPQA